MFSFEIKTEIMNMKILFPCKLSYFADNDNFFTSKKNYSRKIRGENDLQHRDFH